jgi:hypothetical protein
MTEVAEVLTVTEELKLQGERLLADCKNVIVKDDDTWSIAQKKISQGAAIRKEAKKILQPYKDQIKAMRELVKKAEKLITPVNEGCQALVDKIAAYEKERDEIIEAQIQKRREESREAAKVMVFDMEEQGAPQVAIDSAKEMTDLLDAPIHIPTLKGKNTITPSWEVELIKDKEEQIPHEYLIPVNETMRKAVAANIKKFVVAKNGRIEIQGVRIIPVNKSTQRSS